MGFIVWAWWFSYQNLHVASYSRVEATHAAGGLAVLVQPMSVQFGTFHLESPLKINYGKQGEWIYDGVLPGDSAALFPPVRTYSDVHDASGAIFLPHWLIMLVSVVVWLLGLVFLRRRKSRALELGAQGA